MRAVAWKVALWAIALCYPAAQAVGHLVGWLLALAAGDYASQAQFEQALRADRVAAYIVGVTLWLIALIGSMEATRAEDKVEKRMGVTSFKVVLVATVFYIVAFAFNHLRDGVITGI